MSAAVRKESPKQKIEPLSAKDIPENLILAQSAGWKDTEGDWQVLYECALVLGIRGDKGLIAQGALGLFESVGGIAKLVVAHASQGQGYGKQLLDALLDAARKKRVETLGLVTQAQSRSLFESRGFVTMGDIVVFMGSPNLPLGHKHVAAIEDIESVARIVIGSDNRRW